MSKYVCKKRIWVLICIYLTIEVLIMSLCACSGAEKKEQIEEIRIAVLLYDEYESFLNSVVKNMNEISKGIEQTEGINIILDVVSANDNQLTQNDQVEKFISRGYNVLCVNLVDRTDATLIIDKAMEADIPVVFFNREPVEEDLARWDKLYYVGAVAEQSARLQAQVILDALEDPESFDKIDNNHNGVISYVILEGEANHQDAIVRTQVVVDELKNAGYSFEKLGDEYANWNRDQAKSKMVTLIDKYPVQIELVIANNDDMALGALEALKEKGYPFSPFVVGVDGTEAGIEAIRTMKLDGSVKNDERAKANAIIKMAIALAKGESIPDDIELTFGKYVFLPYKIITYDNVQDYIRPVNKR